MLAELKKFIFRGNVMDMAVGVIIATAFTAIINSLVENILMPPLSLLFTGGDLESWKWVLREAQVDANGAEIAEVTIGFGTFLNTIIQFVIIAVSIFFIIKLINKAMDIARIKPAEEEKVIPEDVRLLTEIRDLLQNK